MCIICYNVPLASGIAIFYGDQSLVALIRVLSIIILISGVRNVQKAYVSKHMYFKKFFSATLVNTGYVCSLLSGRCISARKIPAG